MAMPFLRLAQGAQRGLRDAHYAPQRRSTTKFLPAPVKGINQADPPDLVPTGYAEEIVNWWPEQAGLTTRGGSLPWNTQINELQVHSILNYNGEELFSVAGEYVFRYTPEQQISDEPEEELSGLDPDARVQSVTFSNAGLSFLHCCNGSNPPFYYNGTTWTTAAFTLNDESYDARDFNSVTTHLQRLWWTKKGSKSVFFGDVNAVQGPLHELPLGGFMRRGGSVVAISTITQDGMYGSDDLFVAVTSEGEVFLYKGDNPTEIDGFALIGRGQIPRPIGAPRCMVKFGTDVIVVTEAGIVGLNSSLSQVFPGLRTGIMDKVAPLWERYVRDFAALDGWDICLYHKKGLLIINVPTDEGMIQFVVNPDTAAWVTLNGWEQMQCFAEYKGELLGGGTGTILLLDTDTTDYVNGETRAVSARVKHSPSSLGLTGIKKRWTLAKPYIVSSSTPETFFGLVVDFGKEPTLSKMFDAKPTFGGRARWYVSEWNTDSWNVGDTDYRAHTRWMQAIGSGYFVAPIIEIQTAEQNVTYAGVELQYETSNTI